MDLQELRKRIDGIDRCIVELYEERMDVCRQVAEYKIETGKNIFDKVREEEKLAKVRSLTHNDFNSKGITELFEQIMSMSRKLQYQLLNEKGHIGRLPFLAVDELDTQKVRVVFQGAEGAYSQAAMVRFFGDRIDSIHVDSFRDAMGALEEGSADFAVLPIENSTAGIVSEIYDLLVEFENYIVGEQIIRIDHALLGLPEADMDDITDIYSHPQALMQCSKYLESHRDWEKHSLKNTAMSAQKIKEDGKKNKAAIASTLTADIYGLKVLDEAIQNNKNNYTKFIIVANKKIFELRANKISISFEVPHESGSLYHKLSHFIYNGINMNKIESRPVQGKAWEYRFFVDIEGNLNDAAVQNALRGLTEETIRLKILGNYVSAEGNE